MTSKAAYDGPGDRAEAPREARLFDGCCCAGGAAKGYHQAGFDVTGYDVTPQPRYPFRFVLGSVLDVDPQWVVDVDDFEPKLTLDGVEDLLTPLLIAHEVEHGKW